MSAAAQTTPVGEKYRAVSTIAEGGMGRVDLAIRSEGTFQRAFAIKRLKPALRSEPEAVAMFLEEARVAGMLRHVNVVNVLDVGEDDEGPFLVMDFVQGLSASALLRATMDRGIPLVPIPVCLQIMRQVADGLHAAHELLGHDGKSMGLVHRDVSPQNILIGFDGTVRITDFGIAKAIDAHNKTSTGLLKGKAGYMSPEQLRFVEPDRRSDLFALGVVFYEVLTRRRLYRAESAAAAARRTLHEPPPDLKSVRNDVPDDVVSIVTQLLQKSRDDRPQSAKEVSERLQQCIAELNVDGRGIPLSDYMERHFNEDRDRLRVELGSLWNRIDFSSRSTSPVKQLRSVDSHKPLRTTPALPSNVAKKSKSPKRFLLPALVVTGVLIGVGIGIVLSKPKPPIETVLLRTPNQSGDPYEINTQPVVSAEGAGIPVDPEETRIMREDTAKSLAEANAEAKAIADAEAEAEEKALADAKAKAEAREKVLAEARANTDEEEKALTNAKAKATNTIVLPEDTIIETRRTPRKRASSASTKRKPTKSQTRTRMSSSKKTKSSTMDNLWDWK